MTYKTLIVDSSHLAYRVYFALPELSFGGKNTQLVYGFFTNLISLVKKQPVESIVIVWDSGHTAKSAMYSAYKRKVGDPMSEEQRADFEDQFKYLNNLLLWLGLKCCFAEGAEADDVIAHLCNKSVVRAIRPDGSPLPHYIVERPILILSGDHDLHQLLAEDVAIWKPHREDIYTIESFEKDFPGVRPSQYREMLALMGCSGDNVPGVRGIGPKYAYNLIRRYGSVEKIKQVDASERLVRLAQSCWKDVELSYHLVSFVEVDPTMIVQQANLVKVRRHFFALGLDSLIESWQSVVKLSEM